MRHHLLRPSPRLVRVCLSCWLVTSEHFELVLANMIESASEGAKT